MESPPTLSAHDLRHELEEAYRQRRVHHLFAFFGEGVEETIDVGGAKVRVVPVRSELELRARMPALDEDDEAHVAFLVPWTSDVPLDLAGRFAFTGRVRKIGKEAKLRALFGVNEIDDEARRSALATWLVARASEPAGGTARRYPLSGGRLTLDAMWAAWLEGDLGLDAQGGLALDVLLAFAATDGRGPDFVRTMARPEAVATRAAVIAWLERVVGPAGVVVWRAWEEGRGRRALELALVLEPLTQRARQDEGGAVRMWVKTRARDVLGIDKELDVLAIAEALAREAASACRLVERRLSRAEVRALGKAADALVDDAEIRAWLSESKRLPSAWSARLEALGLALARGLAEGTADALREAVQALRALEAHTFFQDPEQGRDLGRAEMAVRLLAWLVARPDRRAEPGRTPYGEAEALGRWYTLEGGFVDRARHGARGTAEGAFGRGIEAVVAAADVARGELDRRFARGLAGWYASGQPATQVVPIHEAVKRIAVRFLEGRPGRRLLVVLMDGMAWAQATEILESLGSRAAPWGPLAWHAERDNKIGEGPLPVVFAACPTVTEVSRSAFFAGKALGKGAKLTTPDPDHWAAHPAVKKLVPAGDVPRLLLRGEGHTAAGGASAEALSLVADPDRRVVAIVVNAIDDSLKASHALRVSWRAEAIASLPDLLEKARESGRAVLLASDHGHVPSGARRVDAASEARGARWRVWPSAEAPVADHEIGLTGPGVYAPPGAHGVVMLTDDTSRYVGSTHAGEHGGATLAEVVAPCLLIGCEDRVGDAIEDKSQAPRAAYVPAWWHFDVSAQASGGVEDVVDAPPEKAPAKVKAQLVLPIAPEPEVAAAAAVAKVMAPEASAFSRSAVLAARTTASARVQVVRAVDVLIERGGQMSGDAFAAAIGVLGYRVGGHIAKLQEVMNLDGYEVLRWDGGARQVHLDRGKLGQLFEVEP